MATERKRITVDVDPADHERLKDVVYAAQQAGHTRVNGSSAMRLGMNLAALHLARKLGYDNLDDVPEREGDLRIGRPPAKKTEEDE